jgi:hypothetical protein
VRHWWKGIGEFFNLAIEDKMDIVEIVLYVKEYFHETI